MYNEQNASSSSNELEWYKRSFGEDYLIVYQHRDYQGAQQEVKSMADWLELPQGASVFDLCCGMGRHSLALDALGYQVTAMDLSEVLLREAVEKDVAHKIKWLHGDMRDIPLGPESFDAVVNLFTSFGYFDKDDENKRVLHEIERLLKPNGKFIIDFLNPGYVKNNLVPVSQRTYQNLRIEEERTIQNGTVQKKITITESDKPDQEQRTYDERVKLYHLSDFEDMLSGGQLRIDQVFGNYEQGNYDRNHSPRLIMVGSKLGGQS